VATGPTKLAKLFMPISALRAQDLGLRASDSWESEESVWQKAWETNMAAAMENARIIRIMLVPLWDG
jgi:hypothetical protein